MKILHLITRMDRGGSAVNTLFSAYAQQQQGHEVTLAFGASLESEMSAQEQAKVDEDMAAFQHCGGTVCVMPTLLRDLGGMDVRALWDVRTLVQQGRFDMVHTHTSKTGALGRVAVALLGKRFRQHTKVVHTPHGHIFHGYFSARKTQVFVVIERFLARYSDALVALTRAERDDHLALKIGRPEQWHVIASGVDVDAIQQAVAQQQGEKMWDAVSVGRLVSIKGMERLMAAWAALCAVKPGVRLAVVGDGEKRAALAAQVKALGIEQQVHFTGWDNPVPYLAAARSFVLLSHNEGMGRAVVEAMAAGLPCVVSDVCGLKELVDAEVGIVVDADDAAAVADAIQAVWQQDMRQAAQTRAQDYSLEQMIASLDALYADVTQ